METALVTLAVGTLIFLGHLFSALFEKTRIPDVLPLVFLGLVVGPICELVTPATLGAVGRIFTTVALLIILFEGGLGLNVASLRASMLPGTRLAILNFVGSILVLLPLAKLYFALSWLEGLVLGAILGGTSSIVVIPLVRKLRLQDHTRTALLLESTFTDVLCIVVTLGLLQAFQFHQLQPSLMLGQIIASFLLAAALGFFAALFWSSILHKVRQLENSTFTTPAFVLIVFGVTELLGYSGAIAALVFGVILGNISGLQIGILRVIDGLQPISLNRTEKTLFAEIVFLLKTFFFVYIGISIRFTDFTLMLVALGLTAALFIMRLPVVRLSLRKTIPRFDASLAAAMVPKGLAPAVLASLPIQAGMAKGGVIQDVVYAVILFSIILTAGLVFLLEKGWLKLPYDLVFSRYATAPEETGALG